MRYHKQQDGEWVQPKTKGYKMACCDCGLVHTLNFRVIKYGGNRTKIQFQAFRNNRSTAAMRKKFQSIKVIKKGNK